MSKEVCVQYLLPPLTASEPQAKSKIPEEAGKGSPKGGFSLLEAWSCPFRIYPGDPETVAYICFKSQTSSGELVVSSSNIVGEGNGTPLQYSCLENPMDGGAL